MILRLELRINDCPRLQVPRRPHFKTWLERSDLLDMGGALCRQPLRGVREQLAQEQGHDCARPATWMNEFQFLRPKKMSDRLRGWQPEARECGILKNGDSSDFPHEGVTWVSSLANSPRTEPTPRYHKQERTSGLRTATSVTVIESVAE